MYLLSDAIEIIFEKVFNDEAWLSVESVRYLEKGTIECGNVGYKFLLELNICGHHSNIHKNKLRWCRTNPGNCGRKSLLFGSCLSALFSSMRHRNFHHSCKIWQLSFDLVKKKEKERFSCFYLANFPFENETPSYFGIGFLENHCTDCNQNLPS